MRTIFTDRDGKPIYVLGLQAHNSSNGCWEMIDSAIDAVKQYHGNTLEVPVYWYQLEPEEGVYDLSQVEELILRVRASGLKLIILWFGSSKNSDMTYVPEWVKADPDRFWMAVAPDGEVTPQISPFCTACYEADKAAFVEMMKAIRRIDEQERTVIAVQVENEIGLYPLDRCYSETANRVFADGVPDGTILQSGFGLKSGWYLDNGVVHFGEYEENYYDFLVWLNRLFENGLIDPDMPSINKATSLAKFSNGEAWACIAQSSATIAGLQYTNADKGWVGVAGRSLAEEEGAEPQFGHMQNSYAGNASAAISTKCSNVEAAARFLDWFYGEENLATFQHGVEGFCYAIVDGEYTRDLQYLIPLQGEGADNVATRMVYGILGTNWPMKMLDGMSHNYYQYPAETEKVLEVWRDNNMSEHIMPPVTMTVDEANEYASLFNDIDSYMKEQISLFIQGKRSLDEYPEYRATLESMGIERMIELEQAAYDRYMAR